MKALLFTLFLVIPVILFFTNLIAETQDNYVLSEVQRVSAKLIDHKVVHGKLPQSLDVIGESKVVCAFLKCFTLVYQTDSSLNDFKLVSKVNYPLIAYFSPEWSMGESVRNCCYGFATSKESKTAKNSFPIYLKDKRFLPVEEWPKL